MALSQKDKALLFDTDDLFITVRDVRLRAFNRFILASNYRENSPKLARLYLSYIEEVDYGATRLINRIGKQIKKKGIRAVTQQIKYYTNPYDPAGDYDKIYQKRIIRLYRAYSG